MAKRGLHGKTWSSWQIVVFMANSGLHCK